MLAATVALAFAANAYELLCTAGFPLVFTRILTLAELITPAYYGYLALYSAVYVLPLLAIAAVFVATLGAFAAVQMTSVDPKRDDERFSPAFMERLLQHYSVARSSANGVILVYRGK